jgi:prevent-host-death family protein
MSYSSRIIPISEFKLRHRELLEKLIRDEEPLLITVRGRGAFVVQLPDVYNRLARGAIEAEQLQLLRDAAEAGSESSPDLPPYGP